MVIGVWHQNHVREVALGEPTAQRRVGIVGPHIAVDHQERTRAEQRQSAQDAAAGLERLWTFLAVLDADAKRRAVAEMRADLRAKPRQVDHDRAESGRYERREMVLDQRAAADLEQRLWPRQRERTHPFSATRGEDHRLHFATAERRSARLGSTRRSSRSTSAASSAWRPAASRT